MITFFGNLTGCIKNWAPSKLTDCVDNFACWFDHLEETSSYKEVQIKKFCRPVKSDCLLTEMLIKPLWN